MSRKFHLFLAGIVFFFTTITTFAETVTFNIEATVDTVWGQNIPQLTSPVNVGDKITGTYTLDTNVPPFNVGIDGLQYDFLNGGNGSIGFALSANDNHFATQTTSPMVYLYKDSHNNGSELMNFYSLSSNNNLPLHSGLGISEIELNLHNRVGLDGEKIIELPLSDAPDLSQFSQPDDSRHLTIRGYEFLITARVTSITVAGNGAEDAGPLHIVPGGAQLINGQQFDAGYYIEPLAEANFVVDVLIRLNGNNVYCHPVPPKNEQDTAGLCPGISHYFVPGDNLLQIEALLGDGASLTKEVIWKN